MPAVTKLLAIACGGAAGAVTRYALSGLVHRYAGTVFPWGTLVVNVSGCFIIGLLWGVSERASVAPLFASLVFVGFLGSFTTFSTFGLETVQLFRDGQFLLGAANVVASNLFGLFAALAGFMFSRLLAGSVGGLTG